MTDSFFQPAPAAGGGATNLDELTDVAVSSPLEYQTLEYDGTEWVNKHASVATYVRNADSVTLNVGTVVYLFGATGDHATVKRADNDSDATSAKTVGMVASASIAANANGVVVTRGYVSGMDLSVGYTAGDVLYLGEDGAFTKTKPSAPEHLVFVGVVVRATNNGIIYVATQNGFELDELHNVSVASPKQRHVLRYHAASGLWRNEDPALQTPVNLKWFYPVEQGNIVTLSAGAATIGGATRIVFDTACSITDIGLSLIATYTGATTRTYRLGIYRDNGSNYPGDLAADAGTVSIAQNATAGQKSVALGSAVSVSADEVMWLAVACDAGNTGPNLAQIAGAGEFFRTNGAVNDYFPFAAGYNYTNGSGTSFPATFAAAQGITAAGIPVPFVKVSV